MFDTDSNAASLPAQPNQRFQPDQLEQRLVGLEALISTIRGEQVRLLRLADLAQLGAADGARSLREWTSGRLDVTHEHAGDLVHAARSLPADIERDLADGNITFDRAVATSRLHGTGAPQHLIDSSAGHDLAGVRRLAAAQRRLEPGDEAEIFDSRHAAVQLSLDNTKANVWASLSGTDSAVVTQALHEWADRLPSLPDGSRDTLAHRQADAFVAIFQHALTSQRSGDSSQSRGPHLLLTADLAALAETGGAAGVQVVGGPRVGINALEEALCNGSVSLDVKLDDGRILGLGSDADTIPPRVRRNVLARDGGCTADGCDSRYRLQVHHIIPRSQGGTHDPTNLTTLCWYHHHRGGFGRASTDGIDKPGGVLAKRTSTMVVHGMGYAIDPQSPPGRRRFSSTSPRGP